MFLQKKIAIIGFGFSGLSLAWAFLKQGFEVEVFEKKSLPGGLIQTQHTPYGLIEQAASSILLSKNVELMAKDFKIQWAQKKPSHSIKWIYARNQARRWPLSFPSTLKNLWPLFQVSRGRLSYSPQKHETVHEWGHRVFNSPHIINDLIGPALQGIYAQGPENLSASLVLKSLFSRSIPSIPRTDPTPLLLNLDTPTPHKGSYAPQGGMHDFFSQAMSFIEKHPRGHLHLGVSKDPQSLNDSIVFDTRPNPSVNYLPITTITGFYKNEARPSFQGFGCLFPQSSPFLGVLFNSDIFENRASKNMFSETWILSGDQQSLNTDFSSLSSFRSQMFKTHITPPEFFRLTFWPQGIPSYDLHLEKYIKDTLSLQKLHPQGPPILFGNFSGHIGLHKILEKSIQIAKQITTTSQKDIL